MTGLLPTSDMEPSFPELLFFFGSRRAYHGACTIQVALQIIHCTRPGCLGAEVYPQTFRRTSARLQSWEYMCNLTKLGKI